MTTHQRPMTQLTPALRRRNLLTALALVAFAFTVASSVFVWRYSHNQPAIPQGGSYGATYQIQK